MSRAAKMAKGLGALALLVALVGGVPWALWHYVGWPLPHGVPSLSQLETGLTTRGIPDMVLLKALACLVWVTWALLVASLAAELPAALRGRSARHVVGPLQPLVSHLVMAVIVGALALAPRGAVLNVRPLGAGIGAVAHRPPVAAVALVRETRPNVAPARATGNPAVVTSHSQAPPRTYVVERHDTLWGIAGRELGDPLRWQEIYELNHGRAEPGGATLDDPHWIYPGWTLLLPVPPAPLQAHPAPPPAPAPPAPRAPETATTSTTTSVPVPQQTQPPAAAPVHHGHPHAVPSPALVELPSGSVVAGSFASGVLAAVAIGRLRRRHGYRPSPPAPGVDLAPSPLGPTLRHLAAGLAERSPELPGEALDDQRPELPEDDVEHREHPDLVEVGVDDGGGAVRAALCALAGVALVGPAADDVVRSWVATMLTRAGPVASEVLVTAPAAERLFPGLAGAPGVRVVESAERAVRVLEAAAISSPEVRRRGLRRRPRLQGGQHLGAAPGRRRGP